MWVPRWRLDGQKAKRRAADPSGAGGGSGGATSRKGGSSGNDKYYSQQKSHEDLEEELQTAIRRLDDVKAYQDDEFNHYALGV